MLLFIKIYMEALQPPSPNLFDEGRSPTYDLGQNILRSLPVALAATSVSLGDLVSIVKVY